MINNLYTIFKNLELSWIDSSSDIVNSKVYNDLLSIFPNLESFFREGRVKDEDEFQRTVRHIFRLFKIYFIIQSGDIFQETLSSEASNIIKEKLSIQISQNDLIIPIILMYHDIGRLDNKKEHPYYSYLIISREKMLKAFELSYIDKILINKVIQYHLIFATIYTGESTFYGVYSLLNDTDFTKLLDNKKYVDRFIDLLEIFTYLDIMGYSYARIYDHYISYYEEINIKLKNILYLWPKRDKALKKSLKYSREWMEWRIAGALRIFQYENTESYLTKNFYIEKVKSSFYNAYIDDNDWESIKNNYLMEVSKVQIKYGLAILMLLAIGKFFRGPIKENQEVSKNIAIFWILLSKEIKKRSKNNDSFLWNVHFIKLPNWWKWDRKFKKELSYDSLNHIIKNATQEFNEERREFNLYLDFSSVFF
ncbi:MAG: hypothetical protein ACFFE4_20865 [Candidatus Thorarchaeota archaeon]